MKTENNALIKHAAAVHVSNVLTLNQRKIANILLKNAYFELGDDKWHSIKIKDLLDQLGWKDSSNWTELIKSDLRALNTVQLEWNILRQDRKKVWNVSTLLADAKIECGTIKYSYSLAMRAALYNPNIYAKLDLMVQKLFKAKHSLVLWEYICCELNTTGKSNVTTKWMSLENVRRIFGLQTSKTYYFFNALNRSVLEPSVKEINDKSGIMLTMETKKAQRKVEAVRFIAIRPLIPMNEEEKDLNKDIKLLGLSVEKIKNDENAYGGKRVRSAIEYTRKQISFGKVINNVAAFYNMALRENWTEAVSSKEIRTVEINNAVKQLIGPDVFLEFMEDLKNRVGASVFCSWFIDLEFVSFSEGKMILKTSSKFKKDYIQINFEKEIKEAIAKSGCEIDII